MIDRTNNKSIRAAYGNALVTVGKENQNVVVLDADVAKSTMSVTFQKEFPERFFDMGIAEQDMIATAAGLASQGKIPFASTFAVFATGRTYDQIRNGICYGNLNVKVVGTHGGITVGEDGASHQALEDVCLMRALPNMTVIVPADCKECEEAVKYAAEINGPVYIRVARSNVPNVFGDDYKLAVDGQVLREGKDVTIITNGETLVEVLDAAEILEQKGVSAAGPGFLHRRGASFRRNHHPGDLQHRPGQLQAAGKMALRKGRQPHRDHRDPLLHRLRDHHGQGGGSDQGRQDQRDRRHA